MKQVLLSVIFVLFTAAVFSQAISQKNHTVGYTSMLISNGIIIKNTRIAMLVSIAKGTTGGTIVYSEQHVTKTDSSGKYHIEIGTGKSGTGQFDSINWSDGVYYLKNEIDPSGGSNYSIKQNILMRISPELGNDYDQGTVSATDHPDWGEWRYKNNRSRRPKLVTIDLSTSYANLAYPGNTYPIYRHYEWCDPDGDGIGNSFSISFSENVSNEFIENTTKLGDVRLYPTAFQDLIISSTNTEIIVSIKKPVAVANLSETYAVKGPWKFIYYIEW